MPTTDEIHWTTDHDTFLGMPGGKEAVDWFGFVPSFHDATFGKLELTRDGASISINAFRMTAEVGSNGFYVLDRHVLATFHCSGVSAFRLEGEPDLIVSDLGIRRLLAKPGGWHDGEGPNIGDFEVAWDSCWGFDGAIFAREVRLSIQPTTP